MDNLGGQNEVETQKPPEAPPQADASPAEENEKIDFSVWVVDDDPSVVEMSLLVLGPEYTSVIPLKSGQSLIEELKTHKPGLIIIDNQMPNMTGLEAIRTIRSDPSLKNIPIIMRSSDQGDIRAQAEAAGASSFLAKPTKNATLLAEIERLRLESKQ